MEDIAASSARATSSMAVAAACLAFIALLVAAILMPRSKTSMDSQQALESIYTAPAAQVDAEN